MSDGITDAYRDQRREERIVDLLDTLVAFVKNDTDETRFQVLFAAQACDEVPRGLFGAQTQLADSVSGLLEKVASRDPQAWARMLALAARHDEYRNARLKALLAASPWAGRRMAIVSFHPRNVEDGASLASVLAPYMHDAGNGTRFGGNPSGHFSYVVFYDGEDTMRTIAESAVLLDTHVDSYRTGRTDVYLPPTSHRVADLEARQKMFDDARKLESAAAAYQA